MATPKLTRCAFQMIADVIRTADICSADRSTLTADFRTALYATNQNFNADKFTRACTPDAGKVVRHG
jgi:hypothetical protein